MDAANSTIASQPGREMQSEPREAALQHVEHVVAWQQERTRRLLVREAHERDQLHSASERTADGA